MAYIHPSNLKAIVTNNTVKLTWSVPYYGPCTFNVRRGSSSSQETTTIATGLIVATYTDTSPLSGQNFYLVDAIYPAEPSVNEASASVNVIPPPSPPTNIQLGVFVGTGEGQVGSPTLVQAFATATNTNPTLVTDFLPSAAYTGSYYGNLTGWGYLTTEATLASWMTNWVGSPYQMVLGVPMVCLDANGHPENTLAQGTSGSVGANWTAIGTNLVKLGFGNAILRLGWEFDGNWYPWSVLNSTDAVNFATYWQNIVTLLRAVPGANFKFMWSPAGIAGVISQSLLEACWPGPSYVDYLTLDPYDWSWDGSIFPGGSPNNTCTPAQSNALFATFETAPLGLNWLVSFAKSQGKPFGLAEFAVTSRNDGHGLGDDPTYIQNFYNWAITNGAEIMLYFSGPPDGVATYTLTSFPNSLAEFKTTFG